MSLLNDILMESYDSLEGLIDKAVSPSIVSSHMDRSYRELTPRGKYARVWDIGDGRVVKVSKKPDRCYRSFLEVITGPGKGNPYFPIVYKHKIFGDRVVVLMEMLKVSSRKQITVSLGRGNEITTEEDNIVQALMRTRQGRETLVRLYPGIDKALNLIESIVGCHYDLHGDNIGWRLSNGHLVLMDPLKELQGSDIANVTMAVR